MHKVMILLPFLLYSSPVSAHKSVGWTGQQIAATAKELGSPKKNTRAKGPYKPKARPHKREVIVVGHPITVGVGSLEPNHRTVVSAREAVPDREECTTVPSGPARASRAIADAAGSKRDIHCR